MAAPVYQSAFIVLQIPLGRLAAGTASPGAVKLRPRVSAAQRRRQPPRSSVLHRRLISVEHLFMRVRSKLTGAGEERTSTFAPRRRPGYHGPELDEGHYHFHVGQVQRSKGHSAVAGAAYRAGEKLTDTRTGETHDYRRRDGVLHAELILPEGAPDWAQDRAALWNRAEAMEKRKDAQVARSLDFGLPHQVSAEDRLALVRDFVRATFVKEGMVADFAIHAPDRHGDQRNFHAHVLLSLRALGPEGFAAEKNRAWNDRKLIGVWRAAWADVQNRLFEARGLAIRVDHRSFKARGIDREPELKIGQKRSATARRGIEPSTTPQEYSERELRYLRDYAIAEAVKRRQMRHPQSQWCRARRAALYKSQEYGDRLWENFRRAKENKRRVFAENERLRGHVVAARQDAQRYQRAQARATESVREVFAVAFIDGASVKAKFEDFARRKGAIAAAEALLKKPAEFGRLKGHGLFGDDKVKKEGERMLGFLRFRIGEALGLEQERRRADGMLIELENLFERKTGRERLDVEDWAATLKRYQELNDRSRQWQALKKAKSHLRLEQEAEIRRLKIEEDSRIRALEAAGRTEEAAARRQSQVEHKILLPAPDEATKQARKELNRQRLVWAREADRERQAQFRGRGRSMTEEGIDPTPRLDDWG